MCAVRFCPETLQCLSMDLFVFEDPFFLLLNWQKKTLVSKNLKISLWAPPLMLMPDANVSVVTPLLRSYMVILVSKVYKSDTGSKLFSFITCWNSSFITWSIFIIWDIIKVIVRCTVYNIMLRLKTVKLVQLYQ